jgi:Ca2+-binding EF-hand superfamily protein
LTREKFHDACLQLKNEGVKISESAFEDRLFLLFDSDHNGTVNLKEFLAGMATLILGSVDDKLYLTFRAFDVNGDNNISEEELKEIFKRAWLGGLFQLVKEDDLGADSAERASSEQEFEAYADELATKFAHKAFTQLDTDHSGGLTFEEFKAFAAQCPKITTQVNGLSKEVPVTLLGAHDEKHRAKFA